MRRMLSSGPDFKMEAEQDGRIGVCPVNATLTLLEKSYVLQILHRLYNTSPLRFTELQEILGASPKVMTSRLQELGGLGIVIRRSHDEIPPRVEYELSPKGKDLVLCIPTDLSASTVRLPIRTGNMFENLKAWIEKYNSFVEVIHKK
jgi:DNA-binding HxlR family transcriptional regulator